MALRARTAFCARGGKGTLVDLNAKKLITARVVVPNILKFTIVSNKFSLKTNKYYLTCDQTERLWGFQ